MSERIVLAEIELTTRGESPLKGTRYLIVKDTEQRIHRCETEFVWMMIITRIIKEDVDSDTIDVEPIEWDDKNFQRIQHSLYYPRHIVDEIPRNVEEN